MRRVGVIKRVEKETGGFRSVAASLHVMTARVGINEILNNMGKGMDELKRKGHPLKRCRSILTWASPAAGILTPECIEFVNYPICRRLHQVGCSPQPPGPDLH